MALSRYLPRSTDNDLSPMFDDEQRRAYGSPVGRNIRSSTQTGSMSLIDQLATNPNTMLYGQPITPKGPGTIPSYEEWAATQGLTDQGFYADDPSTLTRGGSGALKYLTQFYNLPQAPEFGPAAGLFGSNAVTDLADRGDLAYQAAQRGYGPYVAMAGVGAAGLAGVGGAGAGGGLAAGGSAPLAETGSLTMGGPASGFMTPAGEALAPNTAGFAGSVGSPVATGAGALPEWAAGAPAAGATTAGGGAIPGTVAASGAAGTGTALSRIIDGTASNADWVSVLGTAGATGLGMFGANQQANSLERLAEQTRAERAPFLQAGTNWLQNPDAYWQGPGQASLDANLRRLSASHGNPISSPTALGIASQAGLQDWRNAWSTAGNLGLGGQDIRANLGTGAARAEADIWGNLAGGVSDIINPRKSLADLMREYAVTVGGQRV